MDNMKQSISNPFYNKNIKNKYEDFLQTVENDIVYTLNLIKT